MLEFLAPLLYYLFVVAGSITLGYLVLRMGYAEVRTFSREERLGLAAVVGGVLALVAFVIDAIVSSPEMFLAAKGYAATIMFALLGVFLFAFKLYFNRTGRFMTIGIPFGKPPAKQSPQVPGVPAQRQGSMRPETSLDALAALKPRGKEAGEEIAEFIKR
jgi:hypothetical protein